MTDNGHIIYAVTLIAIVSLLIFGVLNKKTQEVEYLTQKVQEERDNYNDMMQDRNYWRHQYYAQVVATADERTQVELTKERR